MNTTEHPTRVASSYPEYNRIVVRQTLDCLAIAELLVEAYSDASIEKIILDMLLMIRTDDITISELKNKVDTYFEVMSVQESHDTFKDKYKLLASMFFSFILNVYYELKDIGCYKNNRLTFMFDYPISWTGLILKRIEND